MAGAREPSQPPRWRSAVGIVLIALTVLAIYRNSFQGAFIFDDRHSIVDNPHIRRLWPLWEVRAGMMRPVVAISFAINYALGGLDVWGYHAVNLLIHLCASLTLYGIVRRTLLTTRLHSIYGDRASWIALAVALLWAAHPVHTQSVTYIVQRAESLMGLWYLLTLYAVIRAAEGRASGRWAAAALLVCALGMGSKAVMVTAPLAAFLYDAVFLAGSVRKAFRARRWLHVGLWATALIPLLLLRTVHELEATAGFGVKTATPLQYALTQPGVVLHYLRLSLWPHPLVLDYDWPVARTAGAIVPAALAVGGLLAATVWALRRHPAVGFLGAFWFLTLMPTSSVLPLKDLAFEHRMYLPMAAVVSALVCGADRLLRRLAIPVSLSRLLAMGLLASSVAALGVLTIRRNADYHSELSIWKETISKRPRNPHAYNGLGAALLRQRQSAQALAPLTEAVRLKPDYVEAHINLGVALDQQAKPAEAEPHFRRALELDPISSQAHNNLAVVLSKQGRTDEAASHLILALRLNVDYADAYKNLGNILLLQGQPEQAASQYRQAIRLRPDDAEAHHHLGEALTELGRLEEAMAAYQAALRLQPNYAEAHASLGAALLMAGRIEEALGHFERAQRLPSSQGSPLADLLAMREGLDPSQKRRHTVGPTDWQNLP